MFFFVFRHVDAFVSLLLFIVDWGAWRLHRMLLMPLLFVIVVMEGADVRSALQSRPQLEVAHE